MKPMKPIQPSYLNLNPYLEEREAEIRFERRLLAAVWITLTSLLVIFVSLWMTTI